MKWEYERASVVYDSIQVLYTEDLIGYSEKVDLCSQWSIKSGWNFEELMEECEKRLEELESRHDNS